MIEWLAQATGNVCYRINNHDHIDLQEYVGNYTVDNFGKLVFKEGLLIEAMRNGYWLILDELNLASTEVLEALNRVLDDNREIFIPEIQETVQAHPQFLLFATQNPPETYGGKAGFVTLRDLFRWGERYKEYSKTIEGNFFDWENYLANEVGETGCGKTTFCQLYANQNDKELYTVNCHMNTESSDFIGSLRPTRSSNEPESDKKLFEWVDGPLVNAMKSGSTFLVDEISLADDSVLERLNSLLEPKRTLFLAEKTISEDYSENFIAGESDSIKIVAEEDFRFVATMNPGGDYAKKELSPALRNRVPGVGKTSLVDALAKASGYKLIRINLSEQTDINDLFGADLPVENQEAKFEWRDGPLLQALKTESCWVLLDELNLASQSVLEGLNACLDHRDLNENEQKQKDGQFKDVNDGGFGEGEGAEDVSKEIKNLNQIEGLEKKEDQRDEEPDEKEEVEEEDKGIDIEDDFEGQTFDKKEKSESDRENNSDEESENEENQMGDVKDDQEILDENIWGDEEVEEEENLEENESNSKNGQEKNENLVAKEEETNKKSKDDKNKKDEFDLNKEFKDSENESDQENKKDDNKEKEEKNSDFEKDIDTIPDNLDLNTSDEENLENDDILDKQLNLDENEEDSTNVEEEQNETGENEEKTDIKDQENENSSEEFNDESIKLEDEIQMKQDNNLEEEMELVDNENTFNKTSDETNENYEINEDSKNKNQTLNEMNVEQNVEEKNSGLNDQQAFSYHESSNLITKESFENFDGENIKKETDYESSDLNKNSQKKYSENIETTKRSQILERKNEKKRFKEDKKTEHKDLYQHIDENMSGDEDIIDKADDSKKNNIKQGEEEREIDEEIKKEKLNDVEMIDEIENLNEFKQTNKTVSEENSKKIEENVKIEGADSNKNDKRLRSTSTFVQRPAETTFHTDLEKLKIDHDKIETDCVDKVLNKVYSKKDHYSEEFIQDSILAWRECEKVVSPLINELTAHLQLILEPTKTTKFKGDFKSGKRLNMRKIIPYIASQYRKDKIWLRRTKPSKREYQILLALDDSGSMVDNHSKKLAFESLILLGKALNLLEVGEIEKNQNK
ncbi:hypothetical protein RND71_043910 [Anisodus tanguticus]|uniref:Midasin n=1 Tax=Anisodus tanguticus TaxID=243964 RepID=A0AAE1QNK2_9SOLA|nr:hypothetical protein RND71_043910 [Anisodus tanguticus]